MSENDAVVKLKTDFNALKTVIKQHKGTITEMDKDQQLYTTTRHFAKILERQELAEIYSRKEIIAHGLEVKNLELTPVSCGLCGTLQIAYAGHYYCPACDEHADLIQMIVSVKTQLNLETEMRLYCNSEQMIDRWKENTFDGFMQSISLMQKTLSQLNSTLVILEKRITTLEAKPRWSKKTQKSKNP